MGLVLLIINNKKQVTVDKKLNIFPRNVYIYGRIQLFVPSLQRMRGVQVSNWRFSMQRQLRIVDSYGNMLVRNMWILL